MRVLGLLLLMLPAAGYATGICEDTGTTYGAPTLFSEALEAFAVPATLAWCEERQDEGSIDEVRGTIAYTELRDVRGNVLGALSAVTGDDAKRLEEVVGVFEAVPAAQLATALAAHGFAPIVARGPTKNRCTIKGAWKATPGQQDNGFPAAELAVEVRAGKRRLLRREVGVVAEARRGDEVVVAHVRATQRKIALFTLRPTCSGPPPGYFGPDDGGSCYQIDDVQVTLLDASAGPLARCFAK